MKDVLIPIDRAGRIVLPKQVRDELAIQPGDRFKVSISAAGVTLTPGQTKSGLQRIGKALVFSTGTGQTLDAAAVTDLLDEIRAERQLLIENGLGGRKKQS